MSGSDYGYDFDYGLAQVSDENDGDYGDYGDYGDDIDWDALEAECLDDIDCWNEAFEDAFGDFDDFDYGNDYGTDDYGTDDYGTDYEMSLAQVAVESDGTDYCDWDCSDYGSDYGDDDDFGTATEEEIKAVEAMIEDCDGD